MSVTRTINKVELTYEAGQISYLRIHETLVIENEDVPATFITEQRLVRVDPTLLMPGEISDLNDLLSNDLTPIANREDPIV